MKNILYYAVNKSIKWKSFLKLNKFAATGLTYVNLRSSIVRPAAAVNLAALAQSVRALPW